MQKRGPKDSVFRRSIDVQIVIRQARPEDCQAVSEVLREAVSWMASNGTPLWSVDEVSEGRISADVNAGIYILALANGSPVGTMKYQLDDPQIWPDVPPNESAFVHRLAVRRRCAGGSISFALLSWAVSQTVGLGRKFLRLDCASDRPKLRAIYERFGFVHYSDRQVGPYLVSRYECAVERELRD